jgi:hypothetical protein
MLYMPADMMVILLPSTIAPPPFKVMLLPFSVILQILELIMPEISASLSVKAGRDWDTDTVPADLPVSPGQTIRGGMRLNINTKKIVLFISILILV